MTALACITVGIVGGVLACAALARWERSLPLVF